MNPQKDLEDFNKRTGMSIVDPGRALRPDCPYPTPLEMLAKKLNDMANK